jgi:hypothetical protein
MAGTVVTTVEVGKKRGVVRAHVALTCASGAVSAQTIGKYYGKLVGIHYEPTAGAGATMTATADVLITDHRTGASLIADLDFGTARFERPTMPIQDTTGTVVAAATTAIDTRRPIFVAGEIDIAIANATTTDTGYIGLVFEENV